MEFDLSEILNAGESRLILIFVFLHKSLTNFLLAIIFSFKLQSRATAAHVYPFLHSPAWIFDCELLLLCTLSGIPAREVGIAWKEVEGSKIDIVRDSINMAIDLLVIRGNYFSGRWSRPVVVEGVTKEVTEKSSSSRGKKE